MKAGKRERSGLPAETDTRNTAGQIVQVSFLDAVHELVGAARCGLAFAVQHYIAQLAHLVRIEPDLVLRPVADLRRAPVSGQHFGAHERAIGVDFVRMRIIVSARPANRSPGSAGSMRTTMRAEVQYHLNATDQWKEADMTEGREAYFDEIADYLENELRVMLR